jgi:hypothetical protein
LNILNESEKKGTIPEFSGCKSKGEYSANQMDFSVYQKGPFFGKFMIYGREYSVG